ncbi:hypothetical protein [Streptomyces indicus]|uniref:Uncharacterized protein n=1 Tax=Streptomyces indicus TaxID=417292 RepID=A0A1G8XDD2_9ACTN|nr:hypothetical protein [Streptomyces indicus]SDJ88481.1 hypothetical protein SAMN05421806_103138 [Streptomyces indicus]
MDTGVSLASVGSRIFDGVLGFLPDWIQFTFVALVLLAVVASWVVKIKRKLDRRRARRQGVSTPAARQGQRSGADYLGPYAPGAQQPTVPQQRSGADFLGSYAPQQNAARRED